MRARICPVLVHSLSPSVESDIKRGMKGRNGAPTWAVEWCERFRALLPLAADPISIVSRTARCKWSSNALCRTKRARLRAAGKVSVNNKWKRVAINFRYIIYHLAVNRSLARSRKRTNYRVVEGKCLTLLCCVNLHYLYIKALKSFGEILLITNTRKVSRIFSAD